VYLHDEHQLEDVLLVLAEAVLPAELDGARNLQSSLKTMIT
jgi:hypothetical protein